MKKFLLFIPILFLFGCDPDNKEQEQRFNPKEMSIIDQNESRFEIERVMVFKDHLAYHSKRGVYIIKDKRTGKEFFGVSGIGISELGSHSSGKHTRSDER